MKRADLLLVLGLMKAAVAVDMALDVQRLKLRTDSGGTCTDTDEFQIQIDYKTPENDDKHLTSNLLFECIQPSEDVSNHYYLFNNHSIPLFVHSKSKIAIVVTMKDSSGTVKATFSYEIQTTDHFAYQRITAPKEGEDGGGSLVFGYAISYSEDTCITSYIIMAVLGVLLLICCAFLVFIFVRNRGFPTKAVSAERRPTITPLSAGPLRFADDARPPSNGDIPKNSSVSSPAAVAAGNAVSFSAVSSSPMATPKPIRKIPTALVPSEEPTSVVRSTPPKAFTLPTPTTANDEGGRSPLALKSFNPSRSATDSPRSARETVTLPTKLSAEARDSKKDKKGASGGLPKFLQRVKKPKPIVPPRDIPVVAIDSSPTTAAADDQIYEKIDIDSDFEDEQQQTDETPEDSFYYETIPTPRGNT